MRITIKYHYMCIEAKEWSCDFDNSTFQEKFCVEILSTIGVFLSDNNIKDNIDIMSLSVKDVSLTNDDGTEINQGQIKEYEQAHQYIRRVFSVLNSLCHSLLFETGIEELMEVKNIRLSIATRGEGYYDHYSIDCQDQVQIGDKSYVRIEKDEKRDKSK